VDSCTRRNSKEKEMILTVIRTGGFAGLTKQGELDTAGQPDADRLESAARPQALGSGHPQPDRYVYRLEVRDAQDADATQHTVAEQDVDQVTAWLFDRVLSR
jgi:hypothetical protein